LPDGEKGHVESFSDYVRDLELFIETVVRPRERHAVYLLSHSMGGTVSLLYAGWHQQTSRADPPSPMLSINTTRFDLLARRTAGAVIGKDYVFGLGPTSRRRPLPTTSHRQQMLRIEPRFVAENPQRPRRSTFGWLNESCRRRVDALDIDPICCSTVAGEDDQVVGKRAEVFCGRSKIAVWSVCRALGGH
jgi:alpha-beta hydrolase superfamily lysophospholipase